MSAIQQALDKQEFLGPNRAHVPLLRRILADIKANGGYQSAWGSAVRVIPVPFGKLSYETRISYVIQPWLLSLLGEKDLSALPLEKATDAQDYYQRPSIAS